MAINLARFANNQSVIMPIVNKWGKYRSRKISLDVEDGWYSVVLGDVPRVNRKATQLEIYRVLKSSRCLKGFPIGTEVIPANFENFARLGFTESVPVNFMNLPLFSCAKIVLWEDGRWYFYEEDQQYQREPRRRAAEAHQSRGTLQYLWGATPEVRYYFLCVELQAESYQALRELGNVVLSDDERSKRVRTFNDSFSGRLRDVVDRAGGKYLSHVKQGDGYLVRWQIEDQIVKSFIRDDFRIISAGFCLSGDDKMHSMASLVNLAKIFKEDRPLYITRE